MKDGTFVKLVVSLLLVVNLTACEPEPASYDAVSVVQRAGGKVECDESVPSKPVVEVSYRWHKSLPNGKLLPLAELTELKSIDLEHCRSITDEGLRYLRPLTKVETLILDHVRITDDGLAHIGGMAELHTLSLHSTEVTGLGLGHLRSLPKLKRLDLYFTDMCDFGIEHLAAHRQLEYLNLSKSAVAVDEIRHLAGLTNLRELNLNNTKMNDESLAHLTGMKKLVRLNLKHTNTTNYGRWKLRKSLPVCQITPEIDILRAEAVDRMTQRQRDVVSEIETNDYYVWNDNEVEFDFFTQGDPVVAIQCEDLNIDGSRLAEFPDIRRLIIESSNITDDDIRHLSKLEHLDSLELKRVRKVTDAGLAHLEGMTQLRKLVLEYTGTTNYGRWKLQQTLPDCTQDRHPSRRSNRPDERTAASTYHCDRSERRRCRVRL